MPCCRWSTARCSTWTSLVGPARRVASRSMRAARHSETLVSPGLRWDRIPYGFFTLFLVVFLWGCFFGGSLWWVLLGSPGSFYTLMVSLVWLEMFGVGWRRRSGSGCEGEPLKAHFLTHRSVVRDREHPRLHYAEAVKEVFSMCNYLWLSSCQEYLNPSESCRFYTRLNHPHRAFPPTQVLQENIRQDRIETN